MAKRVFFFFLVFVSFLLALATLLSLIDNISYWYIKVLDFPRLQILISSMLCSFLLFFIKIKWTLLRKVTAATLVAVIVIQAFYILPYSPVVETKVKQGAATGSENSFRLLVANVWMKNKEAMSFLQIALRNEPDILLAMEVDQWWLDQLEVLDELYPFRMEYPLDNTYGMVLYSKYPLKDKRILFLKHKKVPSFHAKVQLPNGKEFNIHGVHPVPPKPSEYPDNIGEEEVELIKVGKMVAREKKPSMVAGDFNDVAWSNTARLFELQGKLNDTRIGRGLYNSFDAKSWFLRWPLDHVYVTEEFRLLNFKRLPKFGSDHFPLLIELSL